MNPPAIGIDLGTTNSVLASIGTTGQPYSVTNFEGAILTPSKVLIEGHSAVVGTEAMKGAPAQPRNYAEGFKRYMGDDFYPEPIDGQMWRPEVLSALVLRRLKSDATRRLPGAEAAVLTVPAYFDELRRRATWNAALMAGWTPIDLINEPTAAAIAFAYRRDRTGARGDGRACVLVYDLGGGTFDVTILDILRGQEYRTLATDGEVRLGGHDWDARLAAWLAEQFKHKTGTDPLATARGQVEFLQYARGVKHSLSARKKLTSPCMFAGHRAVLEVDQQTFESLTADLLYRTQVTTEQVLDQAKKSWQDITCVLLVGGATRMPMIRAMLQNLVGRQPDASLDADESVAHGAAVYAALRDRPDAPRVVNVNSHSYRVLTHDKKQRQVAVPMILRNSPLPAEATRMFPIARAASDAISVLILEGESDDPAACEPLGEIVVQIPPALDDRRRLADVSLICRSDGGLAGATQIKVAGERSYFGPRISVELVPRKGLSADQVNERRRWIQSLELH